MAVALPGDSSGAPGLARFDDDVLGTAGVTHAVVALGTNDLGQPGTPAAPNEPVPTAEELIAAFNTLVTKSGAAGIQVAVATITPFRPAEGYNDQREKIRQEINEWIRSRSGDWSVLDFDAELRDPIDQTTLAPQSDSGDHVHPNEAGQDRLAQAAAAAFG
jgi:lysophospholipase L1-like esterase